MRSFLAIARAQLSGRWSTLLFALAFGAAPVVAAFISPVVARLGVALIVPVWAVSQLIAFLVGVQLFGEDLGSGRLSFFFARPVSSLAIWGAKVAGSLVFVLLVQVLMMAPMLLAWPYAWDFGGVTRILAQLSPGPLEFAIVSATLLAGGAVTGVVGRARSRWLALDFVAVVAVAAAITDAMLFVDGTTTRINALGFHSQSSPPALRRHIWELMEVYDHRLDALLWAGVGVALIAFALATAAGIVSGRVSARRAHVAASITLWSIAVPSAAGLLLYVRFFLAPL
jgi:hypothetical protein